MGLQERSGPYHQYRAYLIMGHKHKYTLTFTAHIVVGF